MPKVSRIVGFAALCMALLVKTATAATLLVYGDSLSAGYGLAPQQSWVTLLDKRLRAEGYEYPLVNASLSGETTQGGLTRLPRALALHHPRILILELGANDGLRGLPLATTQANLDKMVTLGKAAHAKVLLLGMRLPPNYGPRYTQEFTAMFRAVADANKIALVPFFLERVALDPHLIQADGLHPNAAAQPALLETVWPHLAPLLKKSP